MKPSELKSFIKEAVREAIQEELKDILLEAVRAPKAPIQETYVNGEYVICNDYSNPTKITQLKKEL
jgi:transcription elongation factor GreA-like protein